MNYIKHYQLLIERARNRKLSCYLEIHHILPKCLGGSDDPSNLVELTPEEHYIAHQLLVKIHPKIRKLLHAAVMMTVKSRNHNRSKNKLYGWLKKKNAKAISLSQSGENNSGFGTCWIYSLEEKVSKRINQAELEKYINSGWLKGRKIKFDENWKTCHICGSIFSGKGNLCSRKCNYKFLGNNSRSRSKLFGREKEFLSLIEAGESMNSALQQLGVSGLSGTNYDWAKKTLKNTSKK